MHKKRTGRILALAVLALVIALALANSASIPAAHNTPVPGTATATPTQIATPTIAETPVSQAGSTDAIMWMGLVIVAIILIPIVFTKATWRGS